MTTLASVSAVALFLSGTVANATTYTGVRDVGGNTVQISITTDGAFGLLSPADITDFRVKLAGPVGHYDLTPANAFIRAAEPRLIATPNVLNYDFTNPNGVNYIGFEGNRDPLPYYCLSSSFYCFGQPGEVVSTFPLNAMFPTTYSTNQTELVTIATAASNVAEPSGFVSIAFGVALTGLAAKHNRRNRASNDIVRGQFEPA